MIQRFWIWLHRLDDWFMLQALRHHDGTCLARVLFQISKRIYTIRLAGDAETRKEHARGMRYLQHMEEARKEEDAAKRMEMIQRAIEEIEAR